MRKVIGIALFAAWLLFVGGVQATTYYVDYSAGSDSNNGLSQGAPWKFAPGMNGCAATCNSVTLTAGDKVIFKGGVTWHNDAFPWTPKFSGAPGNSIYYGVDTTWFTGSSWTRPIFNPDAASFSRGGGLERMIYFGNQHDQTFDNIEVTNVLADDGPVNDQVSVWDFGDGSNGNNVVENTYTHGWVNPYFAVGTGNISGGTISNFVPYSYSPNAPSNSWATLHLPVLVNKVGGSGSNMGCGGNGCQATSISGSSPYTIVTNGTGGSCSGCVIEIGADFLYVFAGVEGQCSGCVALANVIDGSDTVAAQINPAIDCSSNNNYCVSGGAIAGWRLPNIWRNNVIRYVTSAFVGACTEWSGNLIEGVRLGPNPSSHTNGIECLDEEPVNGVTLSYNNVIRHTNNPNAATPTGQWSIGLLNQYTPRAGTTEYIFNNVVYDTLQNGWLGLFPGGNGCCGSFKVFNNSSDGGPAFDHSYAPTNGCSASWQSCLFQNNHWVTNNASPYTSGSVGANGTAVSELRQSVATASGQGFSESQSPYAFGPGSSGTGLGSSIAAICSALNVANPAAGAACLSDTTYGVSYNNVSHVVIFPKRTSVTRAAVPQIGAFQGSTGSAGLPAPPSGLSATKN
jgi:hypothetical protein